MARPAKKTFGLTPTQQNSINLDPQRGMLSIGTANVPDYRLLKITLLTQQLQLAQVRVQFLELTNFLIGTKD